MQCSVLAASKTSPSCP